MRGCQSVAERDEEYEEDARTSDGEKGGAHGGILPRQYVVQRKGGYPLLTNQCMSKSKIRRGGQLNDVTECYAGLTGILDYS